MNTSFTRRAPPAFLRRANCYFGPRIQRGPRELDEYYSTFPAEVRERGVLSFAFYPPTAGDFLVARLWDRFLPRWREQASRPQVSTAEEEAKALEYIKRMDSASAVEDFAAETSTVNFMKFDRRVPVRLGKWRLVPPDAEASARGIVMLAEHR